MKKSQFYVFQPVFEERKLVYYEKILVSGYTDGKMNYYKDRYATWNVVHPQAKAEIYFAETRKKCQAWAMSIDDERLERISQRFNAKIEELGNKSKYYSKFGTI